MTYTAKETVPGADREASLSEAARSLLAHLRRVACGEEVHRSDFTIWVALDLTVARPDGMAPHQFAGYLSALEEADLYLPVDGRLYGEVCLGEEPFSD